MAAPEPTPPTPDELRALRARLVRAAGRGHVSIPRADVEDVAQEALLKLVRERPTATAPPLAVRGFVALRQAKVEYIRRRNRAREPLFEVLEDQAYVGREDAELRLLELAETVRHEVGDDVLAFARARQAGLTEAELAAIPGWTPQRAGNARRRLKRAADRLRDELLDD